MAYEFFAEASAASCLAGIAPLGCISRDGRRGRSVSANLEYEEELHCPANDILGYKLIGHTYLRHAHFKSVPCNMRSRPAGMARALERSRRRSCLSKCCHRRGGRGQFQPLTSRAGRAVPKTHADPGIPSQHRPHSSFGTLLRVYFALAIVPSFDEMLVKLCLAGGDIRPPQSCRRARARYDLTSSIAVASAHPRSREKMHTTAPGHSHQPLRPWPSLPGEGIRVVYIAAGRSRSFITS